MLFLLFVWQSHQAGGKETTALLEWQSSERRGRARVSLVQWGELQREAGSISPQTPEQLRGTCKVKSLNCLITEEETRTEASLDPDHSTSVAELGDTR